MRVRVFVFVLATFVANLGVAFGHGPQLQITSDAGRIVTREIQRDGPYSDR